MSSKASPDLPDTKALLRQLPLFAGLGDPDLERLCELAERTAVRPGQAVIEEGVAADALYVILDGTFQVSKRSGNQEVLPATRSAGELLGETAPLDQAPPAATVTALSAGHLLRISEETLYLLLAGSPSAAKAVLHAVVARLRETEAALLQAGKMATLGTLAAGLAHELNNPAAAVARSAALLRGATAAWQRSALELQKAGLSPHCIGRVESLRFELERRAANPADLDPLAFSEHEQEVQAWLEEAGVEDPWEFAAPLVKLGWDTAGLSDAVVGFEPAELRVLAPWLAGGAQVYSLLRELGLGAGQISEIVRAVKGYSHLDQAPIQEIDVHAGIEDTLVIMRHKLKGGVVVRRAYAAGLPRIEAYASELNQVWTNIIDNAVDAMHGAGELTITTTSDDGSVAVEICDTGPGIPPEIQPHIFAPFFSTKGAAGTGLGLHIVYNIVVQKHAGQVSTASGADGTCFRVVLPVRLPHAEDRGQHVESPESAGRRSEPWNLQS